MGVWVMDYELFVGMMLNVDEVFSRQSWVVADGYRLATTRGEVDSDWYESVAESKEEAKEIAWRANADRDEHRVLEKIMRMHPGAEID